MHKYSLKLWIKHMEMEKLLVKPWLFYITILIIMILYFAQTIVNADKDKGIDGKFTNVRI